MSWPSSYMSWSTSILTDMSWRVCLDDTVYMSWSAYVLTHTSWATLFLYVLTHTSWATLFLYVLGDMSWVTNYYISWVICLDHRFNTSWGLCPEDVSWRVCIGGMSWQYVLTHISWGYVCGYYVLEIPPEVYVLQVYPEAYVLDTTSWGTKKKNFNPPTGCSDQVGQCVANVWPRLVRVVRSYPISNPYPNHVPTSGTLFVFASLGPFEKNGNTRIWTRDLSRWPAQQKTTKPNLWLPDPGTSYIKVLVVDQDIWPGHITRTYTFRT